jgi:hypothetical protein
MPLSAPLNLVSRAALLAAFIGGVSIAAVALWPASAAEGTIPNFAPDADTGWLAPDDDFIMPLEGPGPVTWRPDHPYISFYRHPRNPNPQFRVADPNNVILQPWAAESLRKTNEKALSGKTIFTPKERCWPVGVPAFVLYPATPVYFLQTPKEVTMIWMQDHLARHVLMNVPHSRNPKPSWFGESVGHYDGDTLVVDTVGLNTKTFVDHYQTPHSEKLHVVERFRMIDEGQTLEVNLHVEDPGAFTTPWNAMQRYRRVKQGPMVESVCMENNFDHFNQDVGPMPIADKSDF